MDRYERPHRKRHSVAFVTGTIAAGLGAGGTIFIARVAPSPSTMYAFITKLVVEYVTTVVYTVPLTQRQLSVWRGSGAGTAATAIPTVIAHDSRDDATSFFASANGGDVRVSTTGTINVGGVTWEGRELASMQLTQLGAAGASTRVEFNWGDSKLGPPVLAPGQCIGVRTANAFDAGGTWIGAGHMEWYEEFVS